jgi:hypothetical protein
MQSNSVAKPLWQSESPSPTHKRGRQLIYQAAAALLLFKGETQGSTGAAGRIPAQIAAYELENPYRLLLRATPSGSVPNADPDVNTGTATEAAEVVVDLGTLQTLLTRWVRGELPPALQRTGDGGHKGRAIDAELRSWVVSGAPPKRATLVQWLLWRTELVLPTAGAAAADSPGGQLIVRGLEASASVHRRGDRHTQQSAGDLHESDEMTDSDEESELPPAYSKGSWTDTPAGDSPMWRSDGHSEAASSSSSDEQSLASNAEPLAEAEHSAADSGSEGGAGSDALPPSYHTAAEYDDELVAADGDDQTEEDPPSYQSEPPPYRPEGAADYAAPTATATAAGAGATTGARHFFNYQAGARTLPYPPQKRAQRPASAAPRPRTAGQTAVLDATEQQRVAAALAATSAAQHPPPPGYNKLYGWTVRRGGAAAGTASAKASSAWDEDRWRLTRALGAGKADLVTLKAEQHKAKAVGAVRAQQAVARVTAATGPAGQLTGWGSGATPSTAAQKAAAAAWARQATADVLDMSAMAARLEADVLKQRCAATRAARQAVTRKQPYRERRGQWRKGPMLGPGPLPVGALHEQRNPKLEATMAKHYWDTHGRRHPKGEGDDSGDCAVEAAMRKLRGLAATVSSEAVCVRTAYDRVL